MCQTGGPRCASHLKKKLAPLLTKMGTDGLTQNETQEIKALRLEYDGTRTGQKALSDKIESASDDQYRAILEERKEKAAQIRKRFLAEKKITTKNISGLTPLTEDEKSQSLSDIHIGPVMEDSEEHMAEYSKIANFSEEENAMIHAVERGEIPEHFPKSFTDPESLRSVMSHSHLSQHGYYAKVTKEFAGNLKQKIGADAVVLDPMAGRGFFAKAMREQGVKTFASDDKSWNSKHTDSVEDMDAYQSLEKYGDKTSHLVLSWAPMDGNADEKLIHRVKEKYPHITIINIGEDEGGCTNSQGFWDEVYNGDYDTHYPDCGYSTNYGINDSVSFIRIKQ